MATIGNRIPEAFHSTSAIRISPWLAVALTARPPAAAAPTQIDMAACSDSAQIYSVSTSPLATYLEYASPM